MWTSQRIALREFIYIYIGTSHQIWLNVIMCPRPFIRVCVLSFTLFAHFSFTCDVYRHIIIMMRCLLFAWTFISYNSFFLSLSRSLSFSVWWCDETISHSRHAICKIDLVFIADITRKKTRHKQAIHMQPYNTHEWILSTHKMSQRFGRVSIGVTEWKKNKVCLMENLGRMTTISLYLYLSLSCTIGDFIWLAVLHLHN